MFFSYFKFILCPTNENLTKVVNKFLRIMFNARDNLDKGTDVSVKCYPTYTPPFTFLSSTDFDECSDVDEGEVSFPAVEHCQMMI